MVDRNRNATGPKYRDSRSCMVMMSLTNGAKRSTHAAYRNCKPLAFDLGYEVRRVSEVGTQGSELDWMLVLKRMQL